MICNKCNHDFLYENNMIFCPGCGEVLAVEGLYITRLDVALQYIVKSCGDAALKRKGLVNSMLPDILPGNQKIHRLVRQIYLISEEEIGAFVNAASNQVNVERALSKLLSAWKMAAMDKDAMEQAADAFLYAYGLNRNQYLDQDSFVLPKKFQQDRTIAALQKLHSESKLGAWKSAEEFLTELKNADEKLREGWRLFRAICLSSEQELRQLFKKIISCKDDSYKMDVAVLQNALRDAFMDVEAIDFALDCILSAVGIPYTQKLYQQAGASGRQNVRRRANASQQNTGGSTGSGQAGSTTVNSRGGTQNASHTGSTQSAGSSTKVSSSAGAKTRNGSNASINTHANTNANANVNKTVNVSAPTQKKKKKSVFWRLVLIVVALVFVYQKVPAVKGKILPAVQNMVSGKDDETTANTEGKGSEEEDKKTSEKQESVAVSEPKKESVAADPYPAPKVSTSVKQGGFYKDNLIYLDRNYEAYKGVDFSFKFPRVLYNNVAYSFENEGEDVDISFTCNSDPSVMTVTRHPNDGSVSAEDHITELKNSLKNYQVLNEKQSLKGSHMVRLKGTDAEDSSLTVFYIVQISDKAIMQMTLKYPTPADNEDKARKEFLAEVMYNYCSFGGNQQPDSWTKFKKSYGL